MKKYFDADAKTALRETTKASRGTGSNYFSSKDGDNSFKAAAGTPLRIVDYINVPASKAKDGATINAHNVVIFDDNHQMSEARFFAAKGIKWPVGGNAAKGEYLIKALEEDVTLTVVPKDVTTAPLKYADGKFVCRVGGTVVAKPGTETGTGQNKKIVPPSDAIIMATYEVEPVTFPAI